jgi:hypothetical protein
VALPEPFALNNLVGDGGQFSSSDICIGVTRASEKQKFYLAQSLTKLISTCYQLIQDGLGMSFSPLKSASHCIL